MIHAYQEMYVNKAQKRLGEAYDYAINYCGFSGEEFTSLFLTSSLSKQFEKGNPSIIVGKSGIEIVGDIVRETKNKEIELVSYENYARSKEYWIGWAIAYYQWFKDRSFTDIFNVVSYQELTRMYTTLHEADISKFVEIIDERIEEHSKETNLKRLRRNCNLSQTELSEISDVALRSIQMYEQRHKDINKASSETLYKLSKALYVPMEELLEK